MKELLKRKIERIIQRYFYQRNDIETREKLISELNSEMKFNFKDITTPELVNENSAKFQGLDPETNKEIILDIKPTYYQFDIDGDKRRY